MAKSYQTFMENAFINQPPLFTGLNYPFWKAHLIIFLESFDWGVWDVVVNGPYIPKFVIHVKEVEKDFNS